VKEVARIIHVKQWREWRMTGIAFEFGNTTYDCDNRTMITTTKGRIKHGRDRGMIMDVKGYWLDILNGPFVSHGVEIIDDHEDGSNDMNHGVGNGIDSSSSRHDGGQPLSKCLLEVVNEGTGAEQQRHHTVEVAMFNVISLMWGIEVRG
jgi:dynein assembly factor 3